MNDNGYQLNDVLKKSTLNYQLIGNLNKTFKDFRKYDNCNEDSIVFIDKFNKESHDLINKSTSKIIVCHEKIDEKKILDREKTLLKTTNPKLLFTRIYSLVYDSKIKSRIHKTSIISKNAKIGKNVSIGPYTIVGSNCIIGSNTTIGENVSINGDVVIGNNVLIHGGVKIGFKGFGHIINENKIPENFPQLGKVIIKDNVEIGVNSTIARGALDDTLINENVKIDCQVQIGHNSTIDKNSLICSNAVIGGSTYVGENTFIGINATLFDKINVGPNSMIGGGSILTKSIQENSTVVSSPSKIISFRIR